MSWGIFQSKNFEKPVSTTANIFNKTCSGMVYKDNANGNLSNTVAQ